MAITIDSPVSVSAQTADSVWISGLRLNAPGPAGKVTATVVVAPLVTATGSVLRDQSKTIELTDVFAASATRPALASAIQGIYAAVAALGTELQVFGSANNSFSI